jgi:hypothetical protein
MDAARFGPQRHARQEAGSDRRVSQARPVRRSWRRLAGETAIGVFRSAPLEAQLFTFLVMRHPRLFGIVLTEAACKQGSRNSRDGDNASQPHAKLQAGPPVTTTRGQASAPICADRFAMLWRGNGVVIE